MSDSFSERLFPEMFDPGRLIRALPMGGSEHELTVLYALIDAMPDFIYIKDLKSRFLVCNKAHMKILGVTSRREIVGKTDYDFFPEELASLYQRDEEHVITDRKVIVDREEPSRNSFGEEIWLSTTKIPLKDQKGVVIAMAGISRDITDRKNEEEIRKELEDQLRQAQKLESIGQLAGGIAHDFNNMLGAITGYATMMRRKFAQENPVLRDYIDTILDASRRAADLTGKLLAFARKGKYEAVELDIHDTIHDVVNLLEHSIDKRIDIVTHLTAEMSTVRGDRTQLQNTVLNLAVNARDAMPDGGQMKFVTDVVQLKENFLRRFGHDLPAGKYIRVVVSDSGVGMDQQTRARLFEPFFTTKPPGKGTGLGLASVYGTIKSHNGIIEVDSEESKGTRFSVFLPVVEAPAKKTPPPVEREIRKGKATVLVIDDERLVREMAVTMLGDLGYTVHACADGQEGVAFFQEHVDEIDVAIVDMVMPRMGGYDCVNALRKIRSSLKVMISTGYSLATDTQRLIVRGIDGFIQKPFEEEDLAEILDEILNGRRKPHG